MRENPTVSISGKLSEAVRRPVSPRARTGGRTLAWCKAHSGLISFGLLLVFLEFAVWAFAIPSYVMPAPHDIVAALVAGFSTPLGSRAGFYIHIATTLIEALTAFVVGGILGILMGALMVQFPSIRNLILPYVSGIQSIPKVALAPFFIVWFGLGISSKIVLGVLLTFFPLLINTAAGLANVDRDRIELMMSMKASGWQTFRLVKLPSALPFIFAGLEMAAVYAILGAVVGEFVGGQSGLGILILNRNAVLDIAGALAALILLALMGVSLQKAVSIVRAKVLFWEPSRSALQADRHADPE